MVGWMVGLPDLKYNYGHPSINGESALKLCGGSESEQNVRDLTSICTVIAVNYRTLLTF